MNCEETTNTEPSHPPTQGRKIAPEIELILAELQRANDKLDRLEACLPLLSHHSELHREIRLLEHIWTQFVQLWVSPERVTQSIQRIKSLAGIK